METALEVYMKAVVATLSARRQVEHALELIGRRASGNALPAQLLALRRYLRIGDLRLAANWSWSESEIASRRNEEPARTLYAEAEKVGEAFARANPGYNLALSPVRSIESQVNKWLRNSGVQTAGARLVRDAEAELKKPAYPGKPEPAAVRAFAAFLRTARVTPEPTNAAPGTSDHGRGTAVDFVVVRGNQIVAGIESATIASVWKDGGWERKLIEACKGTRLRGPLQNPYEPWHWVLGAGS